MADIQRRPFVNHLRGAPTAHVRHWRRGRLAHDGVGQSFWFRPLSAVLAEVPVDDRELPLLVHGRTADFQDVAVQCAVTFRIADPAAAAARIDFAIDPTTGQWRAAPLEQLGGLLGELAQQHVVDLVAGLPLLDALTEGLPKVRARVAGALAADERLAATGVHVVDVRVTALRPEPEVERALQTPTREHVQQQADRATFERRALAVESERAIAENELATQLELAVREEQLVAQRGANERRRATESGAASQIEAEAEAQCLRLSAQARADGIRAVGAAEADAEGARLAAAATVDVDVLLALAARQLAENLPEIGALTITPDLLTAALNRLAGTP
ncbi:MAG TPA: SPFH domain-containing protein [Egibacteraceae bacterium]|nr:SPFH domain-containing protein [Egibacteraceae bacterium]